MSPVVTEPVKLIEPTIKLKAEFLEMVAEHLLAGESYFDPQQLEVDFRTYIQELEREAQGIGLPPGIVPMTTYWMATPDPIILGVSALRHYLTPALEHQGGHIGYIIRPSQRRQGYGTLILALTLQKAAAKGLKRVRLTCDVDNIGSAKIIKNNGGVLSGQAISKRTGKLISQYWIEL